MKYNIILADPPWKQNKGGLRKSRPNQGRLLDYSTMTLSDIHNVLQYFSENFSDEKCNFFVWTIDKYLFQTESIMKDIGYTLHARIIWDKLNGIAPAFTLRFSHEYILWFYKKGSMYPVSKLSRGKYRDVIQEASTVHSKKPIACYKMIENLFPSAKKLELFARNKRTGWDVWGNEVNSDITYTYVG